MKRLPLLGLLLVLALCGWSSRSLWPYALAAPGVDLFRYWAIGAVHHAFPGQLGSPYVSVDEYSQALMAMLSAGRHTELLATASAALPFDLTASPLHYYLYALAPPDYLQFHRVYRWVQIASAASAMALLAAVLSGRWRVSLLFAGLACFAHDSLLLDVNVGNTNTLQLLLLTLGAVLSMRLRTTGTPGIVAMAAALMLLLLFKPTLALAVGLLGITNLVGHSRTRQICASAGALVSAVLLVLLSSLYFDSLSVWFDWLRELTSGAARMAYPLSAGNVSLVTYLSGRTGCPIPQLAAVMACVLLASLWMAQRTGRPNSGMGSVRRDSMRPLMASSIGILLTLALSPLVWQHYLVLLLLPSVFLMFAPESSRTTVLLASLALLLGLGIGRRLFQWKVGLSPEAVALSSMLAWVPAWLALLCAVHRGAWSQPATSGA